MKKAFLALVLAAICYSGFAEPDLKRSRNLSTSQPYADYFLMTDGRWNYWRSSAVVLADVNAVTNALGLRIDTAELTATANLAYIYGYPRVNASTNYLTNTVSIASMDVASATKTGYRLLHVWVSTNTMCASTTNNIEALTLTTGSQVEEVTADGDYWYISATGGTVTAVIEATAAGTNYLMMADGAAVVSTAIVFE